jgi:hypothetical protein
MANISLIQIDTSYLYKYNNQGYNVYDLQRLSELYYSPKYINSGSEVANIRNAIIVGLTSQPGILSLTNPELNPVHYLITTDGDKLIIWYPQDISPNISIEHRISDFTLIKAPNVNQILPEQNYNILPELMLPPFNKKIRERLSGSRGSLFNVGLSKNEIELRKIPNYLLSIPPNLMRESYETLLSQFYNLPINQSYLPMNFISFQDAQELLKQKQIDRYVLDPLLQLWTGSPNTSNRIITLHTKNGVNYLVKAQFDPITNKIYQPV